MLLKYNSNKRIYVFYKVYLERVAILAKPIFNDTLLKTDDRTQTQIFKLHVI